LIGYLNNNSHRLGYAKRRREGLPIGSGGIESANKYISHARLKRSGAWWLIPNGNNMLRLRCAIYNGTYGRVLQRYIASRHPRASHLGTNG
jgi:flavin-dependent dehydrogenase